MLQCFARFANVDFTFYFTTNLPWCAIGLPISKCNTFVRVLWGKASVLWRLFSTVGDNIITSVLWEDNINTVAGIQYCGVIPSVLWRDTFITVEVVQYNKDNISTVGDSFSGRGYSVHWRITSVHAGDNISTMGVTSVLWRVFSTVGITSLQWETASVVEGIQYIGG